MRFIDCSPARRMLAVVAVVLIACSSARAAEPAVASQPRDPHITVAVLDDDLPDFDRAFVQRLSDELRKSGCEVATLAASQVCDSNSLSPEKHFLYVIPQCRTYPAAGLEPLMRYASRRGHVLFLGGPFLDDPVWPADGGWFNRAAIRAAKNNAQSQHAPLGGRAANTRDWQRACGDGSVPGSWEIVPEGPQGQACFRFWTKNLTTWDGYLSPEIPQLFGSEHALLSFQVKGSPTTPQMVVEIQEQDGARWMAVVDIGAQWQRVGLGPEDFQYWRDSPTRDRRGGPGDRLRPQQARRINFQIAFSHTSNVAPGEHSFWIADVGTSVHPLQDLELTPPDTAQTLETILPRYKVYPVNKPVTLHSAPFSGLPPTADWPTTNDVVCGIARTMGRGFQRDQKWRYIPLGEAVDAAGQHRGHAAWLLINHAVPYTGAAFACLGVNDPATLKSPEVSAAVCSIAARLRNGLFLREAGSEQFAYWPGESVQLGAEVVNVGPTDRTAEVRLVVRDLQERVVWSQSTTLQVSSRESSRWGNLTMAARLEPGTYRVATELVLDSAVVDRIEHELRVLDVSAPASDEFLTVRGNQFYRGDRPWYPVGVNYWPLYVSGMQQDDFWAGWLQQRFYDPELVEEDLRRMAVLGINLVSIQAPDLQFHRNLLDFLARCRRHDIYVNLYCGLASPLGFREKELREFITTARLADNPAIMAYDTIWEPGNYVFQGDRRGGWDDQWRAWVVEQYGSIAAAEADWNMAGRRDSQGRLISPPDEQFREDGPWRTLMAAYRRFMDDLTSRRWNRAHRKLRELDPNHLVSFRQGNTLPHDFVFTGTPKHVDFICPEGYAIQPGEDGYYAAGFITRYVHFTTGGKPIVWSEFGQSVWDAVRMEPSPKRIHEVSQYHEMFYQMALESGANGTIPWWWPGGYREGEKSDFGILNPDGSPRPAARLIEQYGPRLKTFRQWPPATAWFDMDRDAHAGGYWYVCFHTGRDAYRRAVEAGQQLGIRTAGTGTTSATTPLVAVGNRPCTGKNPPRYLNAEFNWLLVQDQAGQWVDVSHGSRIPVSSAGPVKARVCVGNTQEATWLAPQRGAVRPGHVVLRTTAESGLHGQWLLPSDTHHLADADFGEIILSDGITQTTQIELRMSVMERTDFGERRSFVLTVE